MADKSKIEWTEATWNPITGCSVLSPGCTNCYAMRLAGGRLKHHPSRAGLTRDTKKGPVWTGEVRFNEQWLDQPIRWKRPRLIFVCAHGDLFHEAVPNEWIDKVFDVMARAPQHTFQVLTKRSARMREYISRLPARRETLGTDWQLDWSPWPLRNVWLGVSVEDQKRAARLDNLGATPAAVHWVSYEPALGPVDFRPWLPDRELDETGGLDWIVAGAESGPRARAYELDWFRRLRDDCAAAGTAYYLKQLLDDRGHKISTPELDGETHDAYPRKDEDHGI